MDSLRTIAEVAARAAGTEILNLYGKAGPSFKGDGSPVTLTDLRSNEILSTHLSKTNIPILSEESIGIGTPYPGTLWIIDPLDGTKDFLKQEDDFSVMIGLLQDGEPTLGVVYAPVYDLLYYAVQGEGAYKVQNGVTTKLTVVPKKDAVLRFVCSVNNFAPYMEVVSERLSARKMPRGSIGIKSGVLAENEGDFFFSRGNFGEWDVCAPHIILREAGGMVTDCAGSPLVYGASNHRLAHGIIFSNGACHERVLEAVRLAP